VASYDTKGISPTVTSRRIQHHQEGHLWFVAMWVFCEECGSMLRPTQARCPVCRRHPGRFSRCTHERAAARWLSIFFAAVTLAGNVGAAQIIHPSLAGTILAAATGRIG